MLENNRTKTAKTLANPCFSLVIRSVGSLIGDIAHLDGVGIPGDKSISHRAALLAALAEGVSGIENFLVSGVTRAMLNALSGLGISWELIDRKLTVVGKGIGGFRTPLEPIYCGNSGTTMRLLAGAISASGVTAILDGSDGLRRRPMKRIVDPLCQMGILVDHANGHAPMQLSVNKLPLKAIKYSLPVASAQVKSCLLLAALSADGETIIREPGPSRDHTLRMLVSMGVQLDREILAKEVSGFRPEKSVIYQTRMHTTFPEKLHPLNFAIPGDISAASFIFVAGLIVPGSEILLRGIGLNDTRTGLLDVLNQMGANIRIRNLSQKQGEPVGDILVRSSQLHGVKVSGPLVVRMIDEFPIFAIAAACASGKTIVKDARELRYKESDRITALCSELQKIGVQVEETDDGFEIEGGVEIHGAIVEPHKDHRLAMSLVLAGLVSKGEVVVKNAEIINESFPDFAPLLERLGAKVDVRTNG